MAFKQNREPGSKLGSYTDMQDKGLLNKVKEKITEKRESKAAEKQAEIDALKAKRDAHWSGDKDFKRIEIESVAGAGLQGQSEKMQVKYGHDAKGNLQQESMAPYNPPEVKKTLKNKIESGMDTLTQYQKMRKAVKETKKDIRKTPGQNKRNMNWRGEDGIKTKIQRRYGFNLPAEGGSSASGGEDDITRQDFGGTKAAMRGSGAPSGKSRGLAIGGAAIVMGSWLASQGKSLLSGKPARNTRTPYSNTNPTQETLRSGRGKIEK